MCVDVDEPWEVFASWRAVAKCCDCGWTGPGWTEEMGPECEIDLGYGRGLAAVELLLDDGVPDWSIDSDTFEVWPRNATDDEIDWQDRAYELAGLLPLVPEDTQHACDNCMEARRWLAEWCNSFMYGHYLDDIAEHWDDDEITHSLRTGRLTVAVKSRWKLRGRRLTKQEAAKLVDESLAALRELTAA